jgi:citrate synthase
VTGRSPARSALSAHRDGDAAWWETAISEVADGRIVVRGRPIEELIGTTGFVQHMVLLFTGRSISGDQAALLEACMVAGADHGPLAPSIAAARMAATCGTTFNAALATGINLLGNAHGGAAGDATRTFLDVAERAATGGLEAAAADTVQSARGRGDPIPGFGHQLHGTDPRRRPLLDLLDRADADGTIDGRFVDVGKAVEDALERSVGRPVPLNIDGLWAIVCCELDLPADFAMGSFCISRGAGIMAHAYEEGSSGVRIKGPCPPDPGLVRYVGDRPAGG